MLQVADDLLDREAQGFGASRIEPPDQGPGLFGRPVDNIGIGLECIGPTLDDPPPDLRIADAKKLACRLGIGQHQRQCGCDRGRDLVLKALVADMDHQVGCRIDIVG